MTAFDYTIHTSQTGLHINTLQIAHKHLHSDYLRPICEQQQMIFNEVNNLVQQWRGTVILDSGCGKGLSTRRLAHNYPNQLVIGVDKSLARLSSGEALMHQGELIYSMPTDNCLLVQANLVDFWPQVAEWSWPIHSHYILHPNPWPKACHFKRRWHGHPVLADLLFCGIPIIMRSNWQLYLEEFAFVINELTSLEAEVTPWHATPQYGKDLATTLYTEPLSHFDEKYRQAGETIYQLLITGIYE